MLGLAWNVNDGHTLFSAASDGVVRALDLGAGGASTVLHCESTDDDGEAFTSLGVASTGVLALGTRSGHVCLLDPRVNGRRAAQVGRILHAVHSKKVSGCDISVDGTRVATSANDHFARVFDVRTLSSARSGAAKPFAEVQHERAVWGCRLAPSGGRLVTTSYDDTIRVHDIDSDKTLRRIAHNNKTGRWITPMTAIPATDDIVVCGNMNRTISLFNATGSGSAVLSHDEMTSISPVTAFDPSNNMLFGGAASGYVVAFAT